MKRVLGFAALSALAALFSPDAAYAGILTVTQQNYDALSRVQCVAVRMNTALFGSTLPDACALSTEGSAGPDRIARNVYDDAGQLLVVQHAYGTALQQNYATYTYTLNGKRATVEDANANLSAYTYDGLDRLVRLNFPSPTTPHTASTTDYESYGYDANNNRTSLRLRSGETVTSCFDYLNRETVRDFPSSGGSVDHFFGYDALGRRLFARNGSTPQSNCMVPVSDGTGIAYAYDGIGRLTSETSYSRALTFLYEDNLNRTRITWPDTSPGFYVEYTYDAANRMVNVEENGATSGAGLLAVYAYDNIGRRHTITRGNGTVTTYTYDGISRLASLDQNLGDTSYNQHLDFSFNPASQISARSNGNDAYHWAAPSLARDQRVNGLNQFISFGGASYTYDARGNLTSDGSRAFGYDLENHLTGLSDSMVLEYDPLGRLNDTTYNGTVTSFLYDGDRLVATYSSSTERYVHGAGVDEPLVWYHGSGTSDRRYLIADNQGSIIAENGATTTRYTYGPYGEPNSWTGSRFRYTGQIALPELQLYHYKARVYDPLLGRFLQTDPVGYQDDINLYAYVRDDPLNRNDATGAEGAGVWRDPDPLHQTAEEAAGLQQQAPAAGKALFVVALAVVAPEALGELFSGGGAEALGGSAIESATTSQAAGGAAEGAATAAAPATRQTLSAVAQRAIQQQRLAQAARPASALEGSTAVEGSAETAAAENGALESTSRLARTQRMNPPASPSTTGGRLTDALSRFADILRRVTGGPAP